MFDQIIGQAAAKKILSQALQRGRISHAYLFYGPAGTEKETMALDFAKAIFCEGEEKPCGLCLFCRKIDHGNYADLHILEPEGASLKIEQFRRLQKEVFVKPVEGKGHVYIIRQAEKMTTAAANSFLKVLEEPLPGVYFILITENLNGLLPTIVSRCQAVPFIPCSRQEIALYLHQKQGKPLEEAQALAALAKGSLERAEELAAGGEMPEQREEAFRYWQRIEEKSFSLWEMADNFEAKKEKIDLFLGFFIEWYRDALLYNQTQDEKLMVHVDLSEKIKKIGQNYSWQELMRKLHLLEEVLNRLKQNVNYRLEIEYLLLNLRKKETGVGRI